MSADISLEQLKKEKEECDKGCRKYFDEELYSTLCDENSLCPNCKATSLALSKGIELAEKQKKMFEEFINKFGIDKQKECQRNGKIRFEYQELSINQFFAVISELKSKLAEQLGVKE